MSYIFLLCERFFAWNCRIFVLISERNFASVQSSSRSVSSGHPWDHGCWPRSTAWDQCERYSSCPCCCRGEHLHQVWLQDRWLWQSYLPMPFVLERAPDPLPPPWRISAQSAIDATFWAEQIFQGGWKQAESDSQECQVVTCSSCHGHEHHALQEGRTGESRPAPVLALVCAADPGIRRGSYQTAWRSTWRRGSCNASFCVDRYIDMEVDR